MDIDRRKRYFGGLLSEEQLTRTELPEIEDAIVEELDGKRWDRLLRCSQISVVT